jgi:hypothetical protein
MTSKKYPEGVERGLHRLDLWYECMRKAQVEYHAILMKEIKGGYDRCRKKIRKAGTPRMTR